MGYVYEYGSPIGRLTLAGDGERLTGLWMEGQRRFARTLEPGSLPAGAEAFGAACAWLDAYFAGTAPALPSALAPKGTPFQQEVWRILMGIPYGETTTYGEIARRVAAASGRPSMSARAVGGAVGRNPISILIPCHRVTGANGSLTGYAGGIERKLWLLRHEKAILEA